MSSITTLNIRNIVHPDMLLLYIGKSHLIGGKYSMLVYNIHLSTVISAAHLFTCQYHVHHGNKT